MDKHNLLPSSLCFQTPHFTLQCKAEVREWQNFLQAPSTMTGLSDGGHAVNSMPSDRVPSQSTLTAHGAGKTHLPQQTQELLV